MKRFLLPLLAALALPTAVNANIVNYKAECNNPSNLVLKTAFARSGFFSWLTEEDYRESIKSYTEYLVCYKNDETAIQMAATIRGLAFVEIGRDRAACVDWAKGKGTPLWWSTFKKKYKVLIQRGYNHESAFNEAQNHTTSKEEEYAYKKKICSPYFSKKQSIKPAMGKEFYPLP
tara:strand:+ start:1054 stop:1578 length:525 start_codon:yes stop_codon:yes gene_type:complete